MVDMPSNQTKPSHTKMIMFTGVFRVVLIKHQETFLCKDIKFFSSFFASFFFVSGSNCYRNNSISCPQALLILSIDRL